MLSFLWKVPKNTNLKPLEQKVQQLEQKVQDLTNANQNLNQQIQQLVNANQQLQQNLTNLTNQIQPIINDWRHVVRANQTNNFQATQKITATNSALQFVHGANETGYIEFKRDTGRTRGYLGSGQSATDRMDLKGTGGVLIDGGDGGVSIEAHPNHTINFNGAREVNLNNRRLLGLPDPITDNEPFTWFYLTRRIRIASGNWRNFSNHKEFVWPNIIGGVYQIINFEAGYGTTPNFKNPVQIFDWTPENNNNTIRFKAVATGGNPGPNNTLYVKMTYITNR